jgi:hypothetical protein
MNNAIDCHERQYDVDTVALSCLSPKAFSVTQGVVPLIGKLLGWSFLSERLLSAILYFVSDECDWVDVTHRVMGNHVSESQSSGGRDRDVRKAIAALRQDQGRSGFQAVDIRVGRGVRVDGRNKGVPTRYMLRDFYGVLCEVQAEIVRCDLGALLNVERQARFERVWASVLGAHGCNLGKRSNRISKGGAMKEDGNVVTIAAIDDLGERVTMQDYNRKCDLLSEMIFDLYQTGLNLGLPIGRPRKKIDLIADEQELRARDACKRANETKARTR